ncbi:hypothetical protein MSS88_03085 [bacterium]|nr:hypothetical protein [bacterium]
MTTICNGRHRRAGDGLRSETNYKLQNLTKEDLYNENPEQKILTVCLALMMAVVMAVPAFARTEGEYSVSSRAYRFNVGDGATFLNLTGDVGANLYMRRLSLYRTTAPGKDQSFKRVYVKNGLSSGYYYGVNRVDYTGSGTGVQWYMINKDNATFLNGNNAFLWPVSAQNYEINTDSLFAPHTNGQSLKLQEKNLYLTCQSTASGTPVYFSTTPVQNWYQQLV